MKQLIQTDDEVGLLIEVEVEESQIEKAAAFHSIRRVRTRMDAVMETVKGIVRPFSNLWQELSQDVDLQEATVKLSIGVNSEGSFFVAKGGGSANLEVELKFKPRSRSP